MSDSGVTRSQSQPLIDINQMYKIATRENTAWGIEGYQVTKKYNDHYKAAKQKEIDEQIKKKKKPGWPAVKATKRGNFLDDYVKLHNPNHQPNQAKQTNKLPAQYPLQDEWVMKKEVKEKYSQKNKVDLKADKNTFISAIFKEQAKQKFPAPGAYNLSKTDKEIKAEQDKLASKQIKYGELPNYLNDYEWQGNQNPGPGQYNGKIQAKDTFEWENGKKFTTAQQYYKIQPKDWIAKHNKKQPKVEQSKIDPFPMSYKTFGKMEQLHKEKKDVTAVKHWGTTKRIYSIKEEMERDKKLNRVKPPGASQYDLVAQWPESKPNQKNKFTPKNGKATKQFNYNRLSKGTLATRSIYY